MKKYRFLKHCERILPTDEVNMDGWTAVGGKGGGVVTLGAEEKKWFRRKVPHSGKVQFLMHVSILATVTVDCDGKSQEEIEVDAGCLAVQKILGNPTQYIHLENIDWDGCRVDDDECQPAQG